MEVLFSTVFLITHSKELDFFTAEHKDDIFTALSTTTLNFSSNGRKALDQAISLLRLSVHPFVRKRGREDTPPPPSGLSLHFPNWFVGERGFAFDFPVYPNSLSLFKPPHNVTILPLQILWCSVQCFSLFCSSVCIHSRCAVFLLPCESVIDKRTAAHIWSHKESNVSYKGHGSDLSLAKRSLGGLPQIPNYTTCLSHWMVAKITNLLKCSDLDSSSRSSTSCKRSETG